MPRLPADPSLEHLKNQAKTLLARARSGDEQARAWVREFHPDPPAELKLADAQLVVARAYGFPSWPKLHAHLETIDRYSRSPHTAPRSDDAADEFLRLACLTYSSDDSTAGKRRARCSRPSSPGGRCTPRRRRRPRGRASVARRRAAAGGGAPGAGGAGAPAVARRVRAARGRRAVARRQRAPRGWRAARTRGSRCSTSPTRARRDRRRSRSRSSCSTTARTRTPGFLWDGLPSPFTALTGAFGRGEGDPPPHPDALALARLLLEAGADATDTQATYNLHWTEDDAWLELVLEFGYGRGDGGPWHARADPRAPDAARDRRGLPDVGGAGGLPTPGAAAARGRRRPRRPGHPPPDPEGPLRPRGRTARRPHRGRARPAGGRRPASRSSSAPSASRPPTWPPTQRSATRRRPA